MTGGRAWLAAMAGAEAPAMNPAALRVAAWVAQRADPDGVVRDPEAVAILSDVFADADDDKRRARA